MATKQAGGNMTPSRFAKLDTADGVALQCGAGQKTYGIIAEGTRRAPLAGWDDGFAAVLGENVRIYANPEDQTCLLEVVTGCNPGDSLKSDTNGLGTPTTTSGDFIGAIAEEVGSANVLIKVRLLPPGSTYGTGTT